MGKQGWGEMYILSASDTIAVTLLKSEYNIAVSILVREGYRDERERDLLIAEALNLKDRIDSYT